MWLDCFLNFQTQQVELDVEHSMMTPFKWFHYVFRKLPDTFAARYPGQSTMPAGPGEPLRAFATGCILAQARHIEDEVDLWIRAVHIVVHGDDVLVSRMSLSTLS